MRLPQYRGRAGFTLIELLVVIAIIAILVSLLLVGINYAWVRMKITGAATEISQLNAALQAFKSKYGVYPPSRIRLCSNWSTYTTSPTPAANGGPALDAASIAFINRMWPNIGTWTNVDWAGIGQPVESVLPTAASQILEGDQCLLFFLGGIPNSPSGGTFNGFSINPKDPAGLTLNTGRVAAFFTFDPTRAFARNPVNGQYFASYNDYYSQRQAVPYLYFSCNNYKNGYLAGYTIAVLDNSGGTTQVQAYFQTPANQAARQYLNADTCQIICAGADGRFGSGGGPWNAATAEVVYPSGSPGADDQSNFYDAVLGTSH